MRVHGIQSSSVADMGMRDRLEASAVVAALLEAEMPCAGTRSFGAKGRIWSRVMIQVRN